MHCAFRMQRFICYSITCAHAMHILLHISLAIYAVYARGQRELNAPNTCFPALYLLIIEERL